MHGCCLLGVDVMASAPPLQLLALGRQSSGWLLTRLWSRTNQPLAELTLPQLWLAPPAASTPGTGATQHEAASATASSLVPSAVIQSPPTSSIAAVHLTSSRHIATSSHADPIQLVKAATTLQELASIYEELHRPLPITSATDQQAVLSQLSTRTSDTGGAIPACSHALHPPLKLLPRTLCYTARRASTLVVELQRSHAEQQEALRIAGDHSKAGRSDRRAVRAHRSDRLPAKAHLVDVDSHQVEQGRALAQLMMTSIAEDLVGHIDQLPVYHMEQLLVAWADLCFNPGEPMRSEVMWQLRPDACNRMSHADPVQFASMAWSLARLGWMEPQFVPLLESAVLKRGRAFDCASLAMLARTFISAGYRGKEVLLQLGQVANKQLNDFFFKDATFVIEAVSHAGSSSRDFLMQAASSQLSRVHGCTAELAAALAASYARAGCMHNMLLELIATVANTAAEDMTLTLAQASSLISSFAQLGASQPKMHAALCARAAQLLQQWLTAASSTSQVHTSTLTSASLQLPGSSVSTQSTQQQQLSAADLSHFASALNLSRQVAADSKSGILPASAALLDAIGSAAVSMAPHMDVAGLGEVCWLLHDARHHHPALLSAVSVRAEQLGRDWTLQRAAQEEQQGALGQVPDAAEADQHDVWALVKVLAYLNSFDAECWELLNQVMSHPTFATAVQQLQAMDAPPSRTDTEDWHWSPFRTTAPPSPAPSPPSRQPPVQEQLLLLCALLAPLTQQLQQANVGVQGIAQADAGDEQGTWALECAQLLMSILQALSTHVHRPEDFQAKCLLQVAQAVVALGDAGWQEELEACIGDGLRAALEDWERQELQVTDTYRRKYRQCLVSTLQRMKVNVLNAKHTDLEFEKLAITRGLLPQPMVLATYEGRLLAVDVCGPRFFSRNAASDREGTNTQPGMRYTPHQRLRCRQHALTLRGWVPVLLPHTEMQAVMNKLPSEQRAYLEQAVFHACKPRPG